MHHPYYGGTVSRRNTVPISPNVAPPASLIDPRLDNSSFQFAPSSISENNANTLQAYPRNSMSNNQPLHPQNQSCQSQQQAQKPMSDIPELQPSESEQSSPERSLPDKNVTEDNIDSAYVGFILYCNPTISQDVDTEELRKGFRNPPRSDGNSFSPWTLFNLLQRLEKKEIKTWSHLVMQLGVEPPDRERNQSAQKVQQYAVRLKRWLHAYHIDAFFNYLSSKPSTYYTERPRTDAELAETIRENVPPEEDLAVRALLPDWRPKRGRRKADEAIEADTPAHSGNSAIHIGGRATNAGYGSMFEDHYSATPSSDIPWSATHSVSREDVWRAAQIAIAPKTASPGQQHQILSAYPGGASQRAWQFAQSDANNMETPCSEYPQSAITPHSAMPTAPACGEYEPRSAVQASALAGSKSPGSTKRKRHAPAISSAWNQGTTGGKIRGRPPSNRNVQDGPFGTFPVNPNAKEAGTVQNVTSSGISTVQRQPSPRQSSLSPPIAAASAGPNACQRSQPTAGAPMPRSRSNSETTEQSSLARRPSKLQLQVPHHPGGPIRLATPPRVLVNGESQLQAAADHERHSSADLSSHMDALSDSDEMATLEPHGGGDRRIDWKRRCYTLMRKLQEKEEKLKKVRRAVLDAVM